MKTAHRKEFGDFQTPPALALEVCKFIHDRFGDFDTLLEPTCGLGSFLQSGGTVFAKAGLRGFEINRLHLEHARQALTATGMAGRVSLAEQDFFHADWPGLMGDCPGRLLLLGNPPWVTNAEVSSLGGANVPLKNNFQGHRGIAARTGKANFDISEWMLIRLMESAASRPVVLAMLCKTATARKVLRHAWQKGGKVANASVHRIDAARHFGVSVDACLLVVETGTSGPHEAGLYSSLQYNAARTRFGLAGRDMVADLETYERWRHLEGLSLYRWRSGVKHDCAAVMELTVDSPGTFQNQLGERINLEPELVYPLLKCTPLSHGRLVPDRWILLPQKRVGEPTDGLSASAPKAWKYLRSHASRFEARKSSIYQRGAPFSIFGIGDYAFRPWKVAVSGLHRPPHFHVVPPVAEKPVLFDDTCYFVPVESEEEALILADMLNSKPCAEFLRALSTPEAKRPVTVELLQRINIHELAEETGLLQKWKRARDSRSESAGSQNSPVQMEIVMETQPARQRRRKA